MNWRRILWIVAAVAMVVLAIIWVYPSREDFREANASWNGVSDYCTQSGATAINSLSDLPTQPEGTALILIPYTSFTAKELNILSDYVSGGGTLILMDDYGYGNEVLERLDGVDYSFSGYPLLDPLINYKNEQFPKIMDFKESQLTEGMDAIVFDHATCLTGVPDDEVIAKSSSFSFLDKNGNSSYDEGEKKGPFVVVASTQLDEGKLIVISDPSIIINGMLDMENNYTLMENAAEGKQIFLDQSHLPQSMLSRVKEDLGLARGALSHPGVVFGVAGAILALTWRGVWRGSKRR